MKLINVPEDIQEMLNQYFLIDAELKYYNERKEALRTKIKTEMKIQELNEYVDKKGNKVIMTHMNRKTPDVKKLKEFLGTDYEELFTKTSTTNDVLRIVSKDSLSKMEKFIK